MSGSSLESGQLRFELAKYYASITQRLTIRTCTVWLWVSIYSIGDSLLTCLDSHAPILQNGVLPRPEMGTRVDWTVLWNCLWNLEQSLQAGPFPYQRWSTCTLDYFSNSLTDILYTVSPLPLLMMMTCLLITSRSATATMMGIHLRNISVILSSRTLITPFTTGQVY